ncbi:MAG: NUDIX domain-containing protein [Alphaproteobacteria bacterium]|nr:NUDIX domain-containing protein [Alphaproteobacteria bacterium]
MTDIVTPASTILLLRDRPEEMEILMVERHRDMKFMGGALVFPGGKVDPTDEELAAALSTEFDDAALRIAGIREVFEECGILLAREKNDHAMISDEHRHEVALKYRKAIDKHEIPLSDMLEKEGLELALDAMVKFAHWITPKPSPRRYDTHFYLAVTPDDHTAAHDGAESVDSVWIRPSVALEDEAAKRREIVFPTRLNIEKLARSKTTEEALAAARADTIVTVMPRIENGKLHIPKEAGYSLTEESVERAFHK